jgi:hypothetical protein
MNLLDKKPHTRVGKGGQCVIVLRDTNPPCPRCSADVGTAD